MKKYITFRLLLIVSTLYISFSSVAQISKQQAIDIVMDSVVGVNSDGVNVYIMPVVLNDPYY